MSDDKNTPEKTTAETKEKPAKQKSAYAEVGVTTAKGISQYSGMVSPGAGFMNPNTKRETVQQNNYLARTDARINVFTQEAGLQWNNETSPGKEEIIKVGLRLKEYNVATKGQAMQSVNVGQVYIDDNTKAPGPNFAVPNQSYAPGKLNIQSAQFAGVVTGIELHNRGAIIGAQVAVGAFKQKIGMESLLTKGMQASGSSVGKESVSHLNPHKTEAALNVGFNAGIDEGRIRPGLMLHGEVLYPSSTDQNYTAGADLFKQVRIGKSGAALTGKVGAEYNKLEYNDAYSDSRQKLSSGPNHGLNFHANAKLTVPLGTKKQK